MMENQHEKISGYRDLSQAEIDEMNNLKALEKTVLGKLDGVSVLPDIDKRWLAIARTDLEKGFMAAVRSIARPQR